MMQAPCFSHYFTTRHWRENMMRALFPHVAKQIGDGKAFYDRVGAYHGKMTTTSSHLITLLSVLLSLLLFSPSLLHSS